MSVISYEWVTIMSSDSKLVQHSSTGQIILDHYSKNNSIIYVVEDYQTQGWEVFSNGFVGKDFGLIGTSWFTLRRNVDIERWDNTIRGYPELPPE